MRQISCDIVFFTLNRARGLSLAVFYPPLASALVSNQSTPRLNRLGRMAVSESSSVSPIVSKLILDPVPRNFNSNETCNTRRTNRPRDDDATMRIA